MFDRINFMSVVDLVQVLGRTKGFFGSLFGTRKEEHKLPPESEFKRDEDLPTGLIAEKFTRTDESRWKQIMSLLSPADAMIIRKIIAAMKLRDKGTKEVKGDGGQRVGSFRVDVLQMLNRVTEETVREKAKKEKGEEEGKGKDKEPKKDTAEKTLTRKVDPRLTEKDARVLYLRHLAQSIRESATAGKSEDDAIKEMVDAFEAEESIVTGELRQRIKKAAEETGEAALEEILRFRIGKQYDRLKQRNPRASKKNLYNLRLDFLKRRENRRRVRLRRGTRKNLTRNNIITIVTLAVILAAIVAIGLTYGMNKN